VTYDSLTVEINTLRIHMLLSVLQEVFPFEILLVTLPPSCEPGRYEYPELLFPLALLTEKVKKKKE
jgi:hypothetical protein